MDTVISSIVLGELETGIRKSHRPAWHAELLHRFLTRIAVIDFDSAAARHCGEIRAHLERRGTPIGPLDQLIAAHARSLGLTLITTNLIDIQIGRLRFYNFYHLTNGVTELHGTTLGTVAGTPIFFAGGRLFGDGEIDGPCMNDDGTFEPGHSPGKITINGNYTQGPGATLRIEVAGVRRRASITTGSRLLRPLRWVAHYASWISMGLSPAAAIPSSR